MHKKVLFVTLLVVFQSAICFSNNGFISFMTILDIVSHNNYFFTLGDIDNDDKIDIVFSSISTFGVLRNDTTGDSITFTEIWTYPQVPIHIFLGDYNRDKYLDIGITTDNEMKVFKNNQNNTYELIFTTTLPNLALHGQFADFNNDGLVDILTTVGGSQPAVIFTNNGNDTFSLGWAQSEEETSIYSCFNIDTGDLDNDGDIDFVATNLDDGVIGIFRNDGQMNLVLVSTFQVPSHPSIDGRGVMSVNLVDLNNDSQLDLIIPGDGITHYYKNIGNTNYELSCTLIDRPGKDPSVGDYNNNGTIDIVLSEHNDYLGSGLEQPNFRIDKNLGEFNFEPMIINPSPIVGNNNWWKFIDINNDQKLDLLGSTSDGSYKLELWISTDSAINPNIVPEPPTYFTYSFVENRLELVWGNGSDNETPQDTLMYNIRVGTSPSENNIISGKYGYPFLGNCRGFKDLSTGNNRFILKGLPEGKYYWSVQTIDSGLLASPWSAEQTATVNIAPQAVTDLEAVRIDNTIAQLVWTAPGDDGTVNNIVGGKYEIRYTTTTTDSWEIAPSSIIISTNTSPGSIERFTITGLSLKATYYFWLKTTDEIPNWSEVSNKTTIYLSISPAAITDLIGYSTFTPGEIILEWTSVGDDDKTNDILNGRYRIDWTTDIFHIWNYQKYKIEIATSTTSGQREMIKLTNFTNDTTYYFAIYIADENLNWSKRSNITVIWTKDLIPPGRIKNLIVQSTAAFQVNLRWIAPGDDDTIGQITKYIVKYATYQITEENFFQCLTYEQNWVPQQSGTQEDKVIYDLPTGTTLYVAVKSIDNAGNYSLWYSTENPDNFVIVSPEKVPPKNTYGLKAEISDEKVTISWTPVTKNQDGTICDDLAGYKIYSSTDVFGRYEQLATVSKDQTHWTITKPSLLTYYRVSAFDIRTPANESGLSDVISSFGSLIVFSDVSGDRTSIEIPAEENSKLNASPKKVILSRNIKREKEDTLRYYEIEITDPDNKKISYIFEKPVEFSIHYNMIDGFIEKTFIPASEAHKNLAIFWHNGLEWIKLGGRVDIENQRVTINTHHLSEYKLVISKRANKFELIQIYPKKIFTPNNDGVNDTINFVYDSPSSSIPKGEIYKFDGTFIGELKDKGDGTTLFWDGKDNSNNLCPQGVYIYQIKNETQRYSGTVILVK